MKEPSLPPCYALAAVSVEFSYRFCDLQTAAWYVSVMTSIPLDVYTVTGIHIKLVLLLFLLFVCLHSHIL